MEAASLRAGLPASSHLPLRGAGAASPSTYGGSYCSTTLAHSPRVVPSSARQLHSAREAGRTQALASHSSWLGAPVQGQLTDAARRRQQQLHRLQQKRAARGPKAVNDEANDGASTSGMDHSQATPSAATFDKRQLAAMALSPLAALSLPLATDPNWRDSLGQTIDSWRSNLSHNMLSEGFSKWVDGLDNNMTYMEFFGKWTGLDLSQVWDPEMWVTFKNAVWYDQPQLLWNKFIERIAYQRALPMHGLVGDMRISYAKLLQLIREQRVKRIIVYGDQHTAVAEVPHPWHASLVGHPSTYPNYVGPDGVTRLNFVQPNPLAPDDPVQWFCREMPEWDMEKYRLYVDLPGDVWERGELMELVKAQRVGVEWDPVSGQYIMPYRGLTKVFQVKTEMQLLDPASSWDFLGWLLVDHRLEFMEKCAAVAVALRLLSITIAVASGAPIFKLIKGTKKKKDKKESAWERLTNSRARQFNVKDGKSGKSRDTGVRFADIAGMDYIVTEMREVVRMLLGDPAYKKVGARCPRGIIFQGPPGTGKTYMARAIAGEAGVAFFSAVGSEFVEMFAGIAAARVNSLFYNARKKSPAIIFIDEIDAIGRARTTLGGDPGSMERESALLAMLVQMDGIHGNTEQVLTIGATNLAQELDAALLRPGRFEVVYELGQPGPQARLEILKYHSRNKPMENDDLLMRVAEATQGFSAAGLANLMNEAAILTVRRGVPKITLPMVLELVEGINWGTKAARLPDTEAKKRLAIVTAAKAVALALTPGLDEIKEVALWSGKRGLGPSVEFILSEDQLREDWHPEEVELMGWKRNYKVNAAAVGDVPLGEFAHVAGLIVPLYAPRAAEVSLMGPDAASLATAPPLADAFDIGYYCVRHSMVHPRFKDMPPLHTNVWLGDDGMWRNRRDPLAMGFDEELGYHKLCLTLLKASWRRATRLVEERRSAILGVAEALLAAEDERITGKELVALIESSPLDPLPESSDVKDLGNEFMPLLKEVLGQVPTIILTGAGGEDSLDGTAQAADGSAAGTPIGQAAQASFRVTGAGSLGMVSFHGPPSGPPVLRLSDETLRDVSSALMGRLDIVDLIGRNTAEEAAERLKDALMDPATAQRLKAIKRWTEDVKGGSAPFPPNPLSEEELAPMRPGGPAYSDLALDLTWWRRPADALNVKGGPRSGVISWSAMEMLFNDRQRKYFAQDADMPMPEDTTNGRKRAAEEAAKKQQQQ